MRLQPVYLVEPEPEKPPAACSRRTFLLALSLSAGIGYAAGNALARLIAAGSSPSRSSLQPEDEALLQWAEGLQRGDVAALVRDRATFLQVLLRFPEAAPRLRPGFQVLIAVALDDTAQTAELRRSMAKELLQILGDQPSGTRRLATARECDALQRVGR